MPRGVKIICVISSNYVHRESFCWKCQNIHICYFQILLLSVGSSPRHQRGEKLHLWLQKQTNKCVIVVTGQKSRAVRTLVPFCLSAAGDK